jgi:hypothetical protein
MANWTPAGEVPGVLPGGGAPSAPPSDTTNPYATPATSGAPEVATSGSYPIPPVKTCSIPLYLFTYLGGLLLLLVALFSIGATGETFEMDQFENDFTTEQEIQRLERELEESGEVSGTVVALAGTGSLLFLVGAIMSFIFLYRAWFILQPGLPRTTPGKAVGFLFIPFFNLYWKFVAYHGWSQDWNRIRANHGNLQVAPMVPEGLFLAGAICFVAGVIPVIGALLSLVAIVLDIVMTVKIAGVVNQLARGN